MTKSFLILIPMIDRDSFLTPFDKMFDQLVSAHFLR